MNKRRADHVGAHRTAFEKNRKIILATQNVCGICGREIDPAYKYPHPLSPTVDHIVPIGKGGHPSDISNLQAAHRWCNRWKSDRVGATLRRESKKENEKENNLIDLPLHYKWENYKANT